MLWCLTVLDCEIGLPCRMMAYVEYRDIYSSISLNSQDLDLDLKLDFK